jgi:hypothetical protein
VPVYLRKCCAFPFVVPDIRRGYAAGRRPGLKTGSGIVPAIDTPFGQEQNVRIMLSASQRCSAVPNVSNRALSEGRTPNQILHNTSGQTTHKNRNIGPGTDSSTARPNKKIAKSSIHPLHFKFISRLSQRRCFRPEDEAVYSDCDSYPLKTSAKKKNDELKPNC